MQPALADEDVLRERARERDEVAMSDLAAARVSPDTNRRDSVLPLPEYTDAQNFFQEEEEEEEEEEGPREGRAAGVGGLSRGGGGGGVARGGGWEVSRSGGGGSEMRRNVGRAVDQVVA